MFKAVPTDVVWSCILPKCSIDVRISLKIPPNRLHLQPYETKDTLTSITVPLWGTILPLHNGSDLGIDPWRCPVTIRIKYHYNNSYSRMVKDSMFVSVVKLDLRYSIGDMSRRTVIDKLWITPEGVRRDL